MKIETSSSSLLEQLLLVSRRKDCGVRWCNLPKSAHRRQIVDKFEEKCSHVNDSLAFMPPTHARHMTQNSSSSLISARSPMGFPPYPTLTVQAWIRRAVKWRHLTPGQLAHSLVLFPPLLDCIASHALLLRPLSDSLSVRMSSAEQG